MTTFSRSRGFTLLEVLAGLTIFALIASTAYAALHSASRIWERVDARAEENHETWLALNYLRGRLATAVPLGISDGGNRWRLWFDGQPGGITFVSEGSRHVGTSGPLQFTVRHETDAHPPSLMLLLHRVGDGLQIGEVRENALRRTLIADVERVEFSFFGSRRLGEDPAWHSQWRKVQSLPQLVRVQLSGIATGDWPALTVRLRADGLRLMNHWEGFAKP